MRLLHERISRRGREKEREAKDGWERQEEARLEEKFLSG